MSEEHWFPSKESKQVVGRFDWFDILDVAASQAADRKIYKKIPVIVSRVIGTLNDSDVSHKVTPLNQQSWMERFPGAWEAFETGVLPPVDGTLLSDPSVKLDGLNYKQIQELKLASVLTLEQLAGLSDEQCQPVFGRRALREEAKKLIASRTATADAEMRAWAAAQMSADKMPAAEIAKTEPTPKNKGGRPFGSKNRPKTDQAAA